MQVVKFQDYNWTCATEVKDLTSCKLLSCSYETDSFAIEENGYRYVEKINVRNPLIEVELLQLSV